MGSNVGGAFGGGGNSNVLVQAGVAEGRKRRAEEKQEKREERATALTQDQDAQAVRRAEEEKLGRIRVGTSAQVQSGRTGRLGQPITGRIRLRV